MTDAERYCPECGEDLSDGHLCPEALELLAELEAMSGPVFLMDVRGNWVCERVTTVQLPEADIA